MVIKSIVRKPQSLCNTSPESISEKSKKQFSLFLPSFLPFFAPSISLSSFFFFFFLFFCGQRMLGTNRQGIDMTCGQIFNHLWLAQGNKFWLGMACLQMSEIDTFPWTGPLPCIRGVICGVLFVTLSWGWLLGLDKSYGRVWLSSSGKLHLKTHLFCLWHASGPVFGSILSSIIQLYYSLGF